MAMKQLEGTRNVIFNEVTRLLDKKSKGLALIQGDRMLEMYLRDGYVIGLKCGDRLGEEAVSDIYAFSRGKMSFYENLQPTQQQTFLNSQAPLKHLFDMDTEDIPGADVKPTVNSSGNKPIISKDLREYIQATLLDEVGPMALELLEYHLYSSHATDIYTILKNIAADIPIADKALAFQYKIEQYLTGKK